MTRSAPCWAPSGSVSWCACRARVPVPSTHKQTKKLFSFTQERVRSTESLSQRLHFQQQQKQNHYLGGDGGQTPLSCALPAFSLQPLTNTECVSWCSSFIHPPSFTINTHTHTHTCLNIHSHCTAERCGSSSEAPACATCTPCAAIRGDRRRQNWPRTGGSSPRKAPSPCLTHWP